MIFFPGWVEKSAVQFFKDAHVFVFPRWWIEYGSAVLTEAFAFGLRQLFPAGALGGFPAARAHLKTTVTIPRQIERLSEPNRASLAAKVSPAPSVGCSRTRKTA